MIPFIWNQKNKAVEVEYRSAIAKGQGWGKGETVKG